MLAADMDERQCLLVIFGASGDLTRRKLIPGLFELHVAGLLSSHVGVLGISRTPLSDDQFRERMKSACRERRGFDEERWREFAGRMHYLAADAMHAEEWPRITGALCQVQTAHSTGGEILFYLSVAPELYERIIQNIGAAGLNQGIRRWCSAETNPAARRRIIVEKPFGRDLQSAEHLNRVLGRVFDDEDVFRIDHYLGKETVQNLLVFRFANLLFEPLWNRMYIDHVQITAAETVGVGNRAAYYDSAGAMRDMIQSHLLQLMAVVAMEPPNSFRASDLRSEQRHVLEAVRPIAPDEVARRRRARLLRGTRCSARQRVRHICRAQTLHRQLALGGRALLPTHGQAHAPQAHPVRHQLQTRPPPIPQRRRRRDPTAPQPPGRQRAARRGH
jgi:glucose-6-phosphate 1-dehydrogenase